MELIKNGDIRRHLKRASKNYIEKRKYCDSLLKIHLKDKVEYTIPSGGFGFLDNLMIVGGKSGGGEAAGEGEDLYGLLDFVGKFFLFCFVCFPFFKTILF